jgi:hypothetical protein
MYWSGAIFTSPPTNINYDNAHEIRARRWIAYYFTFTFNVSIYPTRRGHKSSGADFGPFLWHRKLTPDENFHGRVHTTGAKHRVSRPPASLFSLSIVYIIKVGSRPRTAACAYTHMREREGDNLPARLC